MKHPSPTQLQQDLTRIEAELLNFINTYGDHLPNLRDQFHQTAELIEQTRHHMLYLEPLSANPERTNP